MHPPSLKACENLCVIEEFNFESISGIADYYRVPDVEHLRINMVVSLDGNFVGPSGSSRDLSGPLDLSALLALRLLSDVVLVGAKTAVGEKYRHTPVRRDLLGIGRVNPPFCLVSSTLRIPSHAPIFSDSENKPFIITSRSTDADWIENLKRLSDVARIHVAETDVLTGTIIREALHFLGFKKIVCEGGPSLLKTLLATDVVDELDLTISPTVVGLPATAGALGDTFRRLHLARSATAENFTFNRYLLNTAQNSI